MESSPDARAYWLTADTLAYPRDLLPDGEDGVSFELWHALDPPSGGDGWGTAGGGIVPLLPEPAGIGPDLADRFPALRSYRALRAVGLTREEVEGILTGAVEVVARRGGGSAGVLTRTGVQIGGVLDDLYAAEASGRRLGVVWAEGAPSLAVWAPTARAVTLLLYDDALDPTPARVPMQRAGDGAWTCAGDPSWAGLAYRYEVAVHVGALGAVALNEVTDPYSVALTTGSTHSVLIDLDAGAYRPAIWTDTPVPSIPRAVDRTIYELHIRDFSISDASVAPEERGTYLAFAGEGDGVAHLRALAAAGLNTVHLLPAFDFTTVPEDRRDQLEPADDLASYPPNGLEQQEAVAAVAARDGFNWGYDPWHYQVPEGSYASEGHQAGGERVAQFRTMVGALHAMGLQVVLDQVYNHTSAAGQDPFSVLDRIVPGYFHRLDERGRLETSTCCPNVATEHAMAEKLMVDSVVHWARHYRIGGFRFDLMGHHSRDNMLAVRAALDELTLARDGINGRSVYLYGEGWNFGEVANDRLFVQARQGALGGTGIGTFSDRLRDAVRGGNAADSSSVLRQGFATGLATDPNEAATAPPAERYADLAHQADLVRLGLAGNLRSFSFVTASGNVQQGDEISYQGVPAGYADSPEEVVTYVDAHDNHTLFDALTLKLPRRRSTDDRVRMAMLALATTALAQTPILWHAGTDLLRSKSLDGDSYNSGDWFNVLDWTGTVNGFGRGLPPAHRNAALWPVYEPFLADVELAPEPRQVALARDWARDLLALRFSTPLFRLGSAELIEERVTFPGSGPGATPGVIVMHVDDRIGPDVDASLDGVLVVFNATPREVTERVGPLAGRQYVLSPVQRAGADAVVRETGWDAHAGEVTVPARTVVVLVEVQA